MVDYPTLGFLWADWIEAHCSIPDGFSIGSPLVIDGWQLWCVVNYGRIREDATIDPNHGPNSDQFTYRRALIVGPQKSGKSPLAAALVCVEAVGPCLFNGWAKGGEIYRCSDYGCSCGFTWEYQPGDPMGQPRPKSLIQLLAAAEEQRANIYRPLQSMVYSGPLQELMTPREDFIRLPNNGRIDPITQSPKSKLGQPVNFAVADEAGLYTGRLAEAWKTIRRGLAGMGGRGIEVTNPWDPMENSSAQQTYEIASRMQDIFVFYRKPDPKLDYRLKRDRRKIHEFVYEGSPWVDLNTIEAEASELIVNDPVQARRFYGNQLVQGLGSYIPEELWDKQTLEEPPSDSVEICLGFDGSRSGDWTAIRACTIDGYRFTPVYGPYKRGAVWDPKDWDGERIPRGEVDAAVAEILAKYRVKRFYCDPRHWETQIEKWASLYGEDVVMEWPTNQIKRMYGALTRYKEDLLSGLTTHSTDELAKTHALHARMVAKPGDQYILGKPAEHMKIDILMADVLAYEAYADSKSVGWSKNSTGSKVIVFGW